MLPEGDERQKQDEESGDAPGRAENGEKKSSLDSFIEKFLGS